MTLRHKSYNLHFKNMKHIIIEFDIKFLRFSVCIIFLMLTVSSYIFVLE